MKWQAVVILFAIAVSIAVPPTLSLTVVHDKQAAIGVLDVCHSAAPALFSNGDMPSIGAYSFSPLPLEACMTAESVVPSFKHLLVAFQNDRPPKRFS
jgi:hypothetical protein